MAIAFDFDGVLVDSVSDSIRVINLFATKYGFDPMDDASYRAMLTCNFYDYWQMLLGPKAYDFVADLRAAPRARFVILPSLMPILEQHRPVIVSSNFSQLIRESLATAGLDLPVYGGDVEKSKVVKLTNLKATPDVFVTDTVGDVAEGKLAGYTTVAVTWGVNDAELLARSDPDHIVRTPDELHGVLSSLRQL